MSFSGAIMLAAFATVTLGSLKIRKKAWFPLGLPETVKPSSHWPQGQPSACTVTTSPCCGAWLSIAMLPLVPLFLTHINASHMVLTCMHHHNHDKFLRACHCHHDARNSSDKNRAPLAAQTCAAYWPESARWNAGHRL